VTLTNSTGNYFRRFSVGRNLWVGIPRVISRGEGVVKPCSHTHVYVSVSCCRMTNWFLSRPDTPVFTSSHVTACLVRDFGAKHQPNGRMSTAACSLLNDWAHIVLTDWINRRQRCLYQSRESRTTPPLPDRTPGNNHHQTLNLISETKCLRGFLSASYGTSSSYTSVDYIGLWFCLI